MRYGVIVLSVIGFLSLLIFWVLGNNAQYEKTEQPIKSEVRPISRVVNVYTSRKEALVKSIFDEFTYKTGIKVNYIVDDASKLIARIEHEKDTTQADMFLTSDITNLVLADTKNLLSPVKSEIIENSVPQSLRDDNWVALTKRTSVIVYSKERVKTEDLGSFEDLASPKWQNRLLLRSSNSPYTQSMIAWFAYKFGENKTREIVRGIVKNMVRKPRGGDTDQIRAIALGEGDVAVVNNYYLARLMASELQEDKEIVEKVGVFFPNQGSSGTMVNVSGAAITKFAKHEDSAMKLIEFMVKPSTQRVYAETNHEYPVIDEVRVSSVLAAWGDYKMDSEALKHISKHSKLAIQIADEEGWR